MFRGRSIIGRVVLLVLFVSALCLITPPCGAPEPEQVVFARTLESWMAPYVEQEEASESDQALQAEECSDEYVPETKLLSYEVVTGDTLWLVALMHATTVNEIAAHTGIDPAKTLHVGDTLSVPLQQAGEGAVALSWLEVDKLFARQQTVARVTDVHTGMSFLVKRRGGWAHADVEPIGLQDTRIMKQIWGEWSWARRPVVVEIAEFRIAASMAGMPHGGQFILQNGVTGHFDIHFLDSTTHGSVYTKNRTPTRCALHQAAVQEAIGK